MTFVSTVTKWRTAATLHNKIWNASRLYDESGGFHRNKTQTREFPGDRWNLIQIESQDEKHRLRMLCLGEAAKGLMNLSGLLL
jgi:hypothetical protein